MSESSKNGVPGWVWYLVFVAACLIGRYLLEEKRKSDIARWQVEQILGPAPKQDWDVGADPYPW
ncbi:MAG TPA: hypothetical protein VF590_08255 [Isosphaeraceae bacterium]|jgi:hypothetical protein